MFDWRYHYKSKQELKIFTTTRCLIVNKISGQYIYYIGYSPKVWLEKVDKHVEVKSTHERVQPSETKKEKDNS